MLTSMQQLQRIDPETGEFASDNSILFYRRRSGTEAYSLLIQHPFQRAMQRQFGSEVMGMDATYGTNALGWPLTALVVKDDAGAGELVTQNAIRVQHLLTCVLTHRGCNRVVVN